jgi:hypothetical protein
MAPPTGVKIQNGITIEGGITVGNVPLPPAPTLMLNLDAADYTSGDWVDTVSSRAFVLNNGVTYSASNGGCLVFDPASNQYAECATSLSSLNTWSAVAWHYYAGTNDPGSPCIITEVFTGGPINYMLGNNSDSSPLLMAGWFNGGWDMTGYTLTPGNWYQIVGTYDGAHVRLYVNTVLVRETPSTGNATSSGNGIRLMRRWDAADNWGGKLGRVQVYDGAMRFGDIVSDWNANKARFGL